MNRIKLMLLTLITLLVAACGGSSGHMAAKPRAAVSTAGDAEAPQAPPAPAEAEQAYDEGSGEVEMAPESASSPPAPADAYGGAEASEDAAPARGAYRSRPRPERGRPGLGTSWGENRQSRVSTAPFFREDPSRPFASVRIFYNDRRGVRAMASRSGISDYGDNLYPAASRQLTVRILDGSGRPLRGTRAGGRTYVVGEHGDRYMIQIRNHTGNRVEAVATVDGLDVIDGRAGSYRKRGYIVGPFATVEIDGFRRSLDTVATFRFGSVRNSYAAKKGSSRNVGVIGVAFFHEAGSRWPWTDGEVDRRHDADPFPGRYAGPPPVY